MKYSSKQNDWADDIRMRLTLLLNGYLEKCGEIDKHVDDDVVNRVSNIINKANSNYIIDEYKGVSDEAVVKMFEMSSKEYCKVFEMMFSGDGALYQIQQKKRIEMQKKLNEIKKMYGM